MSIKLRLKNIDKKLKSMYQNRTKIHFLSWREDYLMTAEEREAMLDKDCLNIVISNLPTKEDYEEYGEIIEQRLKETREKNLRRNGRKKDVEYS